jgi:RNA polymerase sigma-70 factor (ECF subfamily)
MAGVSATDDDLLAAGDMASFEQFYRRHFDGVLAFFARRADSPEQAADLTAETFAAALIARRRYRPGRGRADSWLFSIAYHKLNDARRRGRAELRALERLGMQRPALTARDEEWIEELASEEHAVPLVAELSADERHAVRARIVHGRSYDDIAAAGKTSPAAVRQRVSRGLARVRRQLESHR